MSNVLVFRRRHLIEVERPSRCQTRSDRFFVEVRAATLEDALEQVSFSLTGAEMIVPPVHLKGRSEAA